MWPTASFRWRPAITYALRAKRTSTSAGHTDRSLSLATYQIDHVLCRDCNVLAQQGDGKIALAGNGCFHRRLVLGISVAWLLAIGERESPVSFRLIEKE